MAHTNKPIEMLTEDEALERAKALSLVTAQEDEKRRQHIYGTSTLPVAPESTQSTTNTLIARPRPQSRAGNECSTQSGTLQRPVSPRSDQRSLQRIAPVPNSQRPPPEPNAGQSTISSQLNKTPPFKTREETPLISFSPSMQPRKMELQDFDLSSLDPLNSAYNSNLDKTTRNPFVHNSEFVKQSQQFDSSSSAGFGSNPFSTMETRSKPPNNRSSQGLTRSAPASPKKQLSLAPSPHISLQPPPLSSETSSNMTCSEPLRSITPTPVVSSNPFTRLSNDPFYTCPNQSFHKVPSDPNFNSSYRFGYNQASPVMSQEDLRFGMITAPNAALAITAAAENFPVFPNTNSVDFGDVKSTLSGSNSTLSDGISGLTSPSTSTGLPPTLPPSVSPTPTDGSRDLMNFGEDIPAEMLLSLESFDPLFVPNTQVAQGEVLDSLGLFSNPNNKFERKETPNPFPDVNAVSTQQLLERTSPEKTEPIYKHYSKLSLNTLDDDARSEAPTDSSGEREEIKDDETIGHQEELQDPFSMSELTSALERKRLQHAQEQEKRKQLLRQPSENKRPVSPATAARDERAQRLSRRISHNVTSESAYESLQHHDETATDEIKAFCDMVARLKLLHPHTDASNTGLIIASRLQNPPYTGMTVKVVVQARFITEPFIFTPALSTSVEHMICEVLLSITDDLQSTSADDYLLKVHGKAEYFLNNTMLGEYVYVQNCLKLDEDIRLTIVDYPTISRSLLRTAEDDTTSVYVPKPREIEDKDMKVTRDKLNILMENYYKEVERLRDAAIQTGCKQLSVKRVLQSVKAVCAVLYKMETVSVLRATQRLLNVVAEPSPATPNNRNAFVYVSADGEVNSACGLVDSRPSLSDSYAQLDDLHLALEDLTKSVKGLIEMYCRAFHTDFRFESATNLKKETREVYRVEENLLLHIATAHRIPLKWRTSFEEFRVVVGVYYGWRRLAPEIITKSRFSFSDGLGESVVWDEWISFEDLYISHMPREAQLVLQLIGVRSVQQSSSDSVIRVNTSLGGVAMQIFNHRFELVQGSQLLGLWPGNTAAYSGTNISNTDTPHSVLLQINMPVFDFNIVFPNITEPLQSDYAEFTTLNPHEQEQIRHLLNKDCVTRLNPEEAEYLWSRRQFVNQFPEALPKVLQAAPHWDWRMLQYTYPLVDEWAPLSPAMALQLLIPSYADTFVRSKSVEWLSQLPSDELLDYLPQLVQALKFESYHTSALARLLLERSVLSLRVAHMLYWLLKEAADDVHYRKRYQLMFGALLSVVGNNVRSDYTKQEDLAKMLAAIAEKVKANKDKEGVLQRELENMWEFLQHTSVRLPLDPAMQVNGVDFKSCSYFSSNAFPLKLVLKNLDAKAEPFYVMFKSGDDLRQDMITMQTIKIMDKLWLQAGLDLKIITFACHPTGTRKGLVELVTESETLRKIQVKYGKGVAGSFKDNTIQKWLTVQNPTELEYEKAVSNFTASCAGYCVATYILGICDRHNDNIMVKQSGHLFHIDFGKFLGDAQMFGNIKRDRSPFVLTSDMAYVINGGDKPSHRFQHFVDLCCQAFNILRRHDNLFLSLFSLMLHSSIPGVNEHATKYVQQALMPHCTDAEATVAFTRMIEESLKSTFTQINFFIHNLAQMKFSGHAEGALLSFIPKTYSLDTDGRIANTEIFGFQKRYNPEKYYLFIIKVDRENQKVPSFIFRRYSEFQELQHKLSIQFPLIRFPPLTNRVLIGRTHVKSVAEERKAELEVFLHHLFRLAPEVSQHDLVYTFFHPMLRDEQDIDKTNLQKLKESSPPHSVMRTIEGQIKLSVFYKQDALTVMVMHVKDLAGLVGDPPDPYVKLYLLPDPMKLTKRKTKICKATFHPTYNEMLTFQMPQQEVLLRHLQVTVWSYDSLKENEFLGAVIIKLRDLDLTKETIGWFPLRSFQNVSPIRLSTAPH